MTRTRIVVGSVLVVVALLAIAFVSPPAHPVHSDGATQLDVTLYQPGDGNFPYWATLKASQSVDEIRCNLWLTQHAGPTCDQKAARATFYSSAPQSPHTLYVRWPQCISWSGAGPITDWAGFNVEYVAASRSVVIHCYTATAFVYFPNRLYGSAAAPHDVLVAIPVGEFRSGPVTIAEDDRLEHLIGDKSAEFQLAAAVIS